MISEVRLKNFRCFGSEQKATLAPLTLLVGENSTGKTSFMAAIRTLWNSDIIFQDNQESDFKRMPYDLGSFDEIAHHRGERGSGADTFTVAFYYKDRKLDKSSRKEKGKNYDHRFDLYCYEIGFEKRNMAPSPKTICFSFRDCWIKIAEVRNKNDKNYPIKFKTSNGSWSVSPPDSQDIHLEYPPHGIFTALMIIDKILFFKEFPSVSNNIVSVSTRGTEPPSKDDLHLVRDLVENVVENFGIMGLRPDKRGPYASTPVRSRPRRTYDPTGGEQDYEGSYIPMHLDYLYRQDPVEWERLKNALESFGKEAGLFSKISVRKLGKTLGDPFQLQVALHGRDRKSPMRNLVDVGYGVSQALPIITELLRRDTTYPMFLLQQPEIHLHPSAQAALGSLFCQIASPNHQLVVETHSDHLLDRVRMEVRDNKDLSPDDVSVLFFERNDLEVYIHSIKFDKQGNVLGAPPSYRSFFLKEVNRSLGL